METAFVKDMQRDLSRLYFYLFDTQRYELIEWKKTDHDGQLEKKDELESKFLKLLKIIREIESLLSLSLPKTPDTLEPNKIDGSALLSNKDINLDLRSKTVIDSINRLKDKQSKTCEIENLLKHFYHIFYSTSNYSTIYPKEITKEHTGKKLSEIKESYNFCDKLNKLTKKGGFQKGSLIGRVQKPAAKSMVDKRRESCAPAPEARRSMASSQRGMAIPTKVLMACEIDKDMRESITRRGTTSHATTI